MSRKCKNFDVKNGKILKFHKLHLLDFFETEPDDMH